MIEMKTENLAEKSEYLAEFLGLMSGDGYLLIKTGKKKVYRIQITLNSTEDIFYVNYVSNLIFRLFRVNPTKQNRIENALYLNINNKKIAYFVESLGFPIGRKKNKLKIPGWVFNKKSYVRAFLRGLMETDGSLFFAKRGTYKTNKYPVMEIKCVDKNFMTEVKKAFNFIGFMPLFRECDEGIHDNAYKVQLNGERWLNKWANEIGFNNLNYKTRYIVWKQKGFCPPRTKLSDRMKLISGVGRAANDNS